MAVDTVDIPEARIVPTSWPGCGMNDTATAPGGTTGRGNSVLCTMGAGLRCCFLVLGTGRDGGGNSWTTGVEAEDCCAAVVVTDGRINGSLSVALGAILVFLEVGYAQIEDGVVVDDFANARSFFLPSFSLANSTEAIFTSFLSGFESFCEEDSSFCHLYSSFNLHEAGQPSLWYIELNVTFPQLSAVQNVGLPFLAPGIGSEPSLSGSDNAGTESVCKLNPRFKSQRFTQFNVL